MTGIDRTARRGLITIVISLIPLLAVVVMLRSEYDIHEHPPNGARIVAVDGSTYQVAFQTQARHGGDGMTATLRTSRAYVVGDFVSIFYDSDDPSRVRHESSTHTWRIPLGITAAAWLVAASFFSVAIARSTRARRIVAGVLVAAGLVVAVAGIGLLVWAAHRDYADNQRNWGYLLGFVGLLGGAATLALALVTRPTTAPGWRAPSQSRQG